MVSETPDIISFKSPLKYEVLSQEQLEILKQGTLSLLQDVGVHFPCLLYTSPSPRDRS